MVLNITRNTTNHLDELILLENKVNAEVRISSAVLPDAVDKTAVRLYLTGLSDVLKVGLLNLCAEVHTVEVLGLPKDHLVHLFLVDHVVGVRAQHDEASRGYYEAFGLQRAVTGHHVALHVAAGNR